MYQTITEQEMDFEEYLMAWEILTKSKMKMKFYIFLSL